MPPTRMETPCARSRGNGRHTRTAAYRLGVASRVMAAVLGGYLLAALCSVSLALAMGQPSGEAAHFGILPSFLVWAGAVVWVFAAASATRAWAGVTVPALVIAGMILIQTNGR